MVPSEHRVVDQIVMEVQFVKNHNEKGTRTLLQRLEFQTKWEGKDYTSSAFSELPANAVFDQQHTDVSPVLHLAGATGVDNPCAGVEPFKKNHPFRLGGGEASFFSTKTTVLNHKNKKNLHSFSIVAYVQRKLDN
jgi:hypothetical protein